MLWSTDPDHNSVHVQMHEHMHVHEQWSRDYSLGVCFTGAAPAPAPEQAGHASPHTRGKTRTAPLMFHCPAADRPTGLAGTASADRRDGLRPLS
ncbi:hypothetical protein GCM10010360_67300 [Streptomyces nogalater]